MSDTITTGTAQVWDKAPNCYQFMERADVDAIAEKVAARVAEILASLPKPVTPQTYSRKDAAEYCGLSCWTFDRERKRLPVDLAPMSDTGPLSRRWRKEALDLYLFSGGRLNQKQRGRPRKGTE